MAELSRYQESSNLKGGRRSAQTVKKIRLAVRRGELDFREATLKEGQRLDNVAHSEYGDGRLWWVIAATSDIGWAMQAPVGTLIKIPSLSDIAKLVG